MLGENEQERGSFELYPVQTIIIVWAHTELEISQVTRQSNDMKFDGQMKTRSIQTCLDERNNTNNDQANMKDRE